MPEYNNKKQKPPKYCPDHEKNPQQSFLPTLPQNHDQPETIWESTFILTFQPYTHENPLLSIDPFYCNPKYKYLHQNK